MKSIFVSHASADAVLVDKFVDTLLRNGCNLQPDDIFYTSGEDTGIPSGQDLIATVRSQVGDATLVIALISRTYQTRPMCIAELGAAWSRGDALMPMMLPGCEREQLEGVLDGMTIRRVGDAGALNELHDRVVAATGRTVRAATWSRHKSAWLTELPNLESQVPVPDVASPAEVRALRRDLNGARDALAEIEADNERLEREIAQISELKDAAEVAVVRLPEDENDRFEALVKAVRVALRSFDSVVDDAIWSTQFSSGLKRPSAWDSTSRGEEIDANCEAGYLYEGDEGIVFASTRSRDVEEAIEKVDDLQRFLTVDSSEEFGVWFRSEYGWDPDLRRKAVWDQFF